MQEISEIAIIHKMAANIYLCSDFYLNTELFQSAEIFSLELCLYIQRFSGISSKLFPAFKISHTVKNLKPPVHVLFENILLCWRKYISKYVCTKGINIHVTDISLKSNLIIWISRFFYSWYPK